MAEIIFLRVRNWRTFQHYSKRNPPWIKFYHSILDDFEFMSLPETTQAHVFKLYLLACRTDNKLPVTTHAKNSGFDASWIAKRISANGEVDLEVLISIGFLEGYNNEARQVLAERSQVVSPRREETETETEKREHSKTHVLPRSSKLSSAEIFPISLPLNDGSEAEIAIDSIKEWKDLYPAVDVEQEIRNMRGWLLADPKRRKTPSGIARFITGWLGRSQNRGPSKGGRLKSVHDINQETARQIMEEK